MAEHSHNIEPIRRAKRESAVGGSAYICRRALYDQRTQTWRDFTEKPGLLARGIILPPDAPPEFLDPAILWNAAEASEKHPRATVGRRHVEAIPHELPLAQQIALVERQARWLVELSGVAVEWALHGPDADGDPRNTHAHLQQSSRRVTPNGFGEKSREWDRLYRSKTEQWITGRQLVSRCREVFCSMANEALAAIGSAERMDHRTLKVQRDEALSLAAVARTAGDIEAARRHDERAQALDREPTKHVGRNAIAYERKTYDPTTRRGKSERVDAKIRAPKRRNEARRHRRQMNRVVMLGADAPAPARPTLLAPKRVATRRPARPRPVATTRPSLSIAAWHPTSLQVLQWRRRIREKSYHDELERRLVEYFGRLKHQAVKPERLVTQAMTPDGTPIVVVRLLDGGRLIDHGERVVGESLARATIGAMAVVAQLKQWSVVEMVGPRGAMRSAQGHLKAASIEIHSTRPEVANAEIWAPRIPALLEGDLFMHAGSVAGG